MSTINYQLLFAMVFLLFQFPNFVPFVFGSKKFIRFEFSGGIAKSVCSKSDFVIPS